jgi:hypothetical protein
MTQEEYASARRAYAADCRPVQGELVELASRVERYVDGEAVYEPEAAARRRQLLGKLDELYRLHFPLSLCGCCSRALSDCLCPDD